MESLFGEKWSKRNIIRRILRRPIIKKRKKPKVGFFPLPSGKIVPFKTYVQEMGETPDLLEARPPGWDENKEERRVNKKTRRSLFKSINVVSAALFFFSYGYHQLSLMQNYLHESQFFMQIKYMPDYMNTYGHVQLSAKYGLAAVTAMFAPYLIRIFKDKIILFVTVGFYSIFISLSFLDAKYTIMPSGFIAGLCCMPFLITMSMYMVHLAKRLGDLNKKRPYNGIQADWLLVKFNSLAFTAWYLGFAIAAGTCTYVFHGNLRRNDTYVHVNNLTCGTRYCDKPWPNWWDVLMQQDEIPQINIYSYANVANASCGLLTMAMILVGCMEGQTTKIWSHLKDEKGFELNFKLGWNAIFSWRRAMLAPLFIFMGWSLDFICYSYTRAYIICSVESWTLFLGLTGFGFFATVVGGGVPWLIMRKRAVKPLLIVGVVCYALPLILLVFWHPVASIEGYKYPHKEPWMWERFMFYVVPAMWGVAFSCLSTVITMKIEFEYQDWDELIKMFTVYHHWRAVGVVIGYATRNMSTCTSTKLYGLIGTFVVGTLLAYWYERKRLREPNILRLEKIEIVRFVPNPDPEGMENESDVVEEGSSTTDEDEPGTSTRRKIVRYKRKLPPNDPRLGQAWRTPYLPPHLKIPRKYITPDGNILIMPKHEKPPFEVQDAFDCNMMRDTDFDRVSNAARKVPYQLGYGGKPLFFYVDKLVDDAAEPVPCKFDDRGNVVPGKEDIPPWREEDLASNPIHNYPERFALVLEALKRKREDDEIKKREEERVRRRRMNTVDETANLLKNEE